MRDNEIAVTVDGIECHVSNDAFADIDTLTAFARMLDGDPRALVKFADLFFGRDQFDAIRAQLPNKGIEYAMQFIIRTLDAAAEAVGGDSKN